jgi:hypothetical protein
MIDGLLIRDTSRFALADLACNLGLSADQYKEHLVQCGKDRAKNTIVKEKIEKQRLRNLEKAAANKRKAVEIRISYDSLRDKEYMRLQDVHREERGRGPTRLQLSNLFEKAELFARENSSSSSRSSSSRSSFNL